MEQSYAPIHTVRSRPVAAADLPRVLEDGLKMFALCSRPSGVHPAALAVAHSQTTDQDPLRFFATFDGELVVNPAITRHVRHKVKKVEGCMSFPRNFRTQVWRWGKIEVDYLTFPAGLAPEAATWDQLVPRHAALSGQMAQVFQHEIDHMDAIFIFQRTKNLPEAEPLPSVVPDVEAPEKVPA